MNRCHNVFEHEYMCVYTAINTRWRAYKHAYKCEWTKYTDQSSTYLSSCTKNTMKMYGGILCAWDKD